MKHKRAVHRGWGRVVGARALLGVAVLAGLLWPAVAEDGEARDGVAIVTKKASDATASLTEKEIKEIFLGKKKSWANGNTVKLAILKDGKVHKRFLETYVGKSAMQFTRHWRRLVFAGKGKMPKVLKTEADLLKFIKENKGAVGYVGTKTADESIQVIEVTKEANRE